MVAPRLFATLMLSRMRSRLPSQSRAHWLREQVATVMSFMAGVLVVVLLRAWVEGCCCPEVAGGMRGVGGRFRLAARDKMAWRASGH